MEFDKLLNTYKNEVDNELNSYFDSLETEELGDLGKKIIEDLREFTLRGGKRIRAILVIFGYKAFNGKKNKEILKAAIAVELMQSFLLIHDDIIDCDEKRRGKPTLHKLYENNFSDLSKNPPKLGIDMAIIAGNIASALGQEIIQNTRFEDSVKLKAIKIFNQAIVKTCVGEALDVISAHKKDSNESEIELIQRLKTSTYTFESPLMLGAAFAGADNLRIEELRNFAAPIGEAFQIQDDIIGIFGSEEKIGKPVGNDIREGKKTLLFTEAIKKASNKEKDFLRYVLGNSKIKEDDIIKVKEIIDKTGSLDYSNKKIEVLISSGLKRLDKLEINEEAKNFFRGISNYILRREY